MNPALAIIESGSQLLKSAVSTISRVCQFFRNVFENFKETPIMVEIRYYVSEHLSYSFKSADLYFDCCQAKLCIFTYWFEVRLRNRGSYTPKLSSYNSYRWSKFDEN